MDTPVPYAQFATMASACEMLFNQGKGTVEQRLKAALWVAELGSVQEMIVDKGVDNPL